MAKLPKANQTGKELETKGFVNFGKKAYNQSDGNCFGIACYLAEKFGYAHPKSTGELRDLILGSRERQNWGGDPLPTDRPSEACFVIRTPDNPIDVHVAFELYGKEFNYGPGKREGFPIERRIYLRKNNT
jgi:hypothetical protein